MTRAFEHPLSLRTVAVDLVDVDLLVPASHCKEIVGRRELKVRYAVAGYLAGGHLDVFAGVACSGACSGSCRLTEKSHLLRLCRVDWARSNRGCWWLRSFARARGVDVLGKKR